MDATEERVLASLIRGQRWAALATVSAEGPLGSMVAYAPEPGFAGFLLHLSRLAAHTRNLAADPRASLVMGEPDSGVEDPQTLGRVTITGMVEAVPPAAADYAAARACYLERLPTAEPLFSFGDFGLYRLVPREVRFVGGFARAYSLGAAALRGIAERT